MRRATVLLAAGLAACTGDGGGDGGDDDGTTDTDVPLTELPDDFEATLTRTGGCSDLLVFAVNEADSTMLTVLFARPLEGAGFVDMTDERDLPNPNAVVTVVRGDRVSDLTCDDAVEGPGSVLLARWNAGEGHLSLVVDYDEGDTGALPLADVTLTDVRLRPTSGDEAVEMDDFSWTGVAVGWEPGR
jgi:hypothetical protein